MHFQRNQNDTSFDKIWQEIRTYTNKDKNRKVKIYIIE